MQRSQLSCKNFDNPEVAGAVNPHPDYSYFYSPILNPNPVWRPHHDPHTPVTTADNKDIGFIAYAQHILSDLQIL
ncbi:hypothetical protein EYZ11_013028 [Aspergillus tanneri]|uniref:Uncharacterized protein n=1 Tax=Aspergillus tanneri TaxID=1220188 RepID=A0A4S3J0U4_9EURO|nr:hypothetical protein EYZ11_013028 [Aspergillus tanneri]